MILADENVHGFIISSLRDAGFEIISVLEIASGVTDERVIQMAIEDDYILLTEDKDFGEWVFAHHIKDLSVLFLRYSFFEYREIAESLVRLLKTQHFERPFFTTISTKKVRTRKL